MKIQQLINNWSKLNHLLFPQFCILCSSAQKGMLAICTDCLHELPWHTHEHCPQCGLPSTSNHICGHCLSSPPAFDVTQALFRYEYPLDAMLQRYKYGHQLTMAETFGELMANSILASARPDVIIPMPLHPQRLQERGFNQAVEIGRVVAKRLQLPLDIQSCTRIKLAPPQVSLPLKERVKNMRNAFACHTNLDGLRIALLDDVMTTGASLNALASVVKAAGAAYVECWTVARTLPG